MTEPSSAPRPTLAKVAVLARVSNSTASNALSGRGRVSPETTQRVIAVARSIGYRIDSSARSLSLGRTLTVGVLVPDSIQKMTRQRDSLFWLRLNDGFVGRCSELGCAVTFIGDFRAQLLIDSGVDVLVLLGNHDPDVIAALNFPFGLPVLSGHEYENLPANLLHHDPKLVAQTVIAHFVETGRSHVAWMPGATGEQVPLWEQALRAECRTVDLEFSTYHHDDTSGTIDAAVDLVRNDGIDAIFGMFQQPHILMDALAGRTIRVPDQIAVVVQSEGLVERAITPTVTTLSLCGFMSGELLADHVAAVAQLTEHEQVPLPIELTIRQSSAIR